MSSPVPSQPEEEYGNGDLGADLAYNQMEEEALKNEDIKNDEVHI